MSILLCETLTPSYKHMRITYLIMEIYEQINLTIVFRVNHLFNLSLIFFPICQYYKCCSCIFVYINIHRTKLFFVYLYTINPMEILRVIMICYLKLLIWASTNLWWHLHLPDISLLRQAFIWWPTSQCSSYGFNAAWKNANR